MHLRAMLPIAVLAAGSARVQAVELNTISKVEVRDAGGEVMVTIKGSKPPNFTTFSMMDPPRFVIDISESAFRNVPQDITGVSPLIQVVKNLSYGSEATSIARVMIAFTREVDPPDVQTVANELVVKIVKPPDAAVAQRQAPAEPRAAVAQAPAAPPAAAAPAAAPPAADTAAAEAAPRAAEEQARLEREEQARWEAKARADEERARRAEEEKARAEMEARAKAEVEAELRAQAAQEAQARARVEEQARARAAEEAQARARTEEQARARAGEEAQARARAEEQARARAEQEAQARASAEEQARARAAEEEAQARASEQARLEREEQQARRQAEVQARAESTARAAEEARARREVAVLAATAPTNHVREVGFQMLPEVSRVFVRTAQAPHFTIMEAGENVIRVELANTRVRRRNDTRFMDTSFFPSAVAMVTPSRQGSSYVVEIKLKQRVPYQQKVEGDLLAIDFQRPAGLRSEASPTGSAPAGAAAAEPSAGGPTPDEPPPDSQ